MAYGQARVPACHSHNAAFGKIEDRIARGIATPEEIYLWAFKLHAGLLYLDSRIPWNRAQPDTDSMRVLGLRGQELRDYLTAHVNMFRDVFRVWYAGGTLVPPPLGSVFDLPAKSTDFDFIHSPYGFVALNLGPRFYAICLFDGGGAQDAGYAWNWTSQNAGAHFLIEGHELFLPFPEGEGMFHRTWFAWVGYSALQQQPLTCNVGPTHLLVRTQPWQPPGAIDLGRFCVLAATFGVFLKYDFENRTLFVTGNAERLRHDVLQADRNERKLNEPPLPSRRSEVY
jgi:hypothetical protein